MQTPIYVIPDIHGHLDQLEAALARIEADGGQAAEIVFLGDLVDRGPDSRGVIERLIRGRAEGRRWHVLMGNHDQLFARYLRTGRVEHPRIRSGAIWLDERLGGAATLASYGIRVEPWTMPTGNLYRAVRRAVPRRHLAFLESLPRLFVRGALLFVHAGIRPGVPLPEQAADDLNWIRAPFLDHRDPWPWLVVHGHTALKHPRHFGNRIDLDGGAGFGRPLHAAVFEGRKCWLLTEGGRKRLRP